MYDFLLALIAFAFQLGGSEQPAHDASQVLTHAQQHLTQAPADPQSDPVFYYQAGNGQPENQNLPEQAQIPNNSSSQVQNEDSQVQENSLEPDTTLISAFNQSSGNVIEQVATVAVEKAEPLIPCSDESDPCATPTPEEIEPVELPDPVPSPVELPEFNPCGGPFPITHDNSHSLSPEIFCLL